MNKNKGITLIALVITIIVLLILLSVTIASITGENGILSKAQNAKKVTDLESAEEKVKMAIMAAKSNDGTLAINNLRTEIENEGGTLGDEADFPVIATVDENLFIIYQNGEVESEESDSNTIKTGSIIELTSTLGTKEKFYVLSYDKSENKAKVLAMYNLKVGNIYDYSTSTSTPIDTNSDGYGLQDETMKGYDASSTHISNGVLAFSNTRYWNDIYNPQGNSNYPYVYDSNSNLYQYIEAYKNKLGNTDKVSDVKLASYEDIRDIWMERGKYPWVYSTSYWLGSSDGDNSVWRISSNLGFHYNYYNTADICGVRPVLTIDMSKV